MSISNLVGTSPMTSFIVNLNKQYQFHVNYTLRGFGIIFVCLNHFSMSSTMYILQFFDQEDFISIAEIFEGGVGDIGSPDIDFIKMTVISTDRRVVDIAEFYTKTLNIKMIVVNVI